MLMELIRRNITKVQGGLIGCFNIKLKSSTAFQCFLRYALSLFQSSIKLNTEENGDEKDTYVAIQ